MNSKKTPITELRRWGFFIFLTLTSSGLSSAFAQYVDHYKNFADLSSHLKEGKDYRIEVVSRTNAPITVFAIHGGAIEPGSSELARSIAGEDGSLYLFEGLDSENAEAAHLTATHFDETRALELAKKSAICVSTHGFGEPAGKPQVCLGGANQKLKESFMKVQFEDVEWIDCKRLPGASMKNIVNRCRQPGIQLEMSPELRQKIVQDGAFRARFAKKIRSVFDSIH